MSVPITLPFGQVLIYGAGSVTSTNYGIVLRSPDFKWGNVEKIFDGGETFVYGGTSVLFKEQDVICRLSYNNWIYTIVPLVKLAINEEPVAPAP